MPLNLRAAVSRKSTLQGSESSSDGPLPTKITTPPRNVSTPEPRPKIPTVKSQADISPRTLARKPSQNSIYSTVSKADKKRSAWRGVAKSIPGLLKSSRVGSSTSLASQDPEPSAEVPPPVPEIPSSVAGFQSKIPVKTLSPKASKLLGQDPAIVKNGTRSREASPPSVHEDTSRPSTESSETMVEDSQATIRAITEELSTTRQQLTESTNERSALRDHIRALEQTHEEQLRQRVEQAVHHTRDELSRADISDLEEKQRSLEKRNEDLASQIASMEEEKADSERAATAGLASLQSKVQNLQSSLESQQRESHSKDEKLATMSKDNEGLRQLVARLEESNRILNQGGEEKLRLIAEGKQLKRQLQDAEIFLRGRDEQISALESARSDSDDALRNAHALLDEKELVIGDLQRRSAALEAENKVLGERVSGAERQTQELKESSQHALRTTVDDYERRIIEAANTIQALKDSSPSSAAIEQLQSSLNSSRAEIAEAAKIAADSQEELRQLQEQRATLQETVETLEEQNKASQNEKAELSRIRTAEVEAERRAIHNLRRSIESSEREHLAKEERSALLLKSNEELRREFISLKEQRQREGEEAGSMRKDLEAANATLCALEEKSRLALEDSWKESKKLVEEVDQLRRQLRDLQEQTREREASPPPPAPAVEEKLKTELQGANTTITEQKAVIARLQHSISERSREDRPPQLIVNVKGSRAEPQRRRTISTASRIELTNRSTKHPTSHETLVQAASSTVLPSSKSQNITHSERQASPDETTKMLKDDGRAPQTESESGSAQQLASKQPIKDVKRFKPQAKPTMAYRMGNAVFGSLWKRIWG